MIAVIFNKQAATSESLLLSSQVILDAIYNQILKFSIKNIQTKKMYEIKVSMKFNKKLYLAITKLFIHYNLQKINIHYNFLIKIDLK